MVPVRRYINSSEASLAKSLLDDYGIFCVLLDEHSSTIRAPLAIPMRLMVDEEQLEAADRILAGDLSGAAEIRTIVPDSLGVYEASASGEADARNPWELLAIASLFLVPSICFLALQHPIIPAESSNRLRYVLAKVTVAHFIAGVCILFAIVLIAAYFELLRRRRCAERMTAGQGG